MEDPVFAFDSQGILGDPFPLCNPPYQRFRLMDVQIVQHNIPLRGLGIAGHQALDMRKRIFFRSRRSPGWFDNRLCCKYSRGNTMGVKSHFLLSLGRHFREAGDERNLPQDVPFFHAMHLPFPHHVHDLVAL